MARQSTPTRRDFCLPIVKALKEFGYPSVTPEIVKDVLDAWLEGKRDAALPHGVIGMLAGRQFDEVDEARPGAMKHLANE